ncbi:unnamed protein product [Didymodactylos carnosus]|uniref:Vesicle-fusing ATPase n=1 Tax=Didymodactylos carnosus TaxID=1234261 RepID=A0A815TCL4_9BILA|nr:unnamed protein product [Didymodactylos carnosus]CAF4363547.1 unnamed protein product [Didymodactylos carnosus]
MKDKEFHIVHIIVNKRYNLSDTVGGCEDVFEEIFGDVLLSRFYPSSFINQTGVKYCRGILLYGLPGTGKTLIARTICQVLGTQPKIVNGPEVFSSLLGESEAKIRELFSDAELDEKNIGEDSGLHVIIFDKIDAICKRRSANASSTRDTVRDNVTSQLLTKLDGYSQLNNILVIGTTNLRESVDPALTRPDRLEVTIKVQLPNRDDKTKSFHIYTKLKLQHHLLEQNIDIERIICDTHGLMGAHIEQLVRIAINNALIRGLIARETLDVDETSAEQTQINNSDFTNALRKARSMDMIFAKKRNMINSIIYHTRSIILLLRLNKLNYFIQTLFLII